MVIYSLIAKALKKDPVPTKSRCDELITAWKHINEVDEWRTEHLEEAGLDVPPLSVLRRLQELRVEAPDQETVPPVDPSRFDPEYDVPDLEQPFSLDDTIVVEQEPVPTKRKKLASGREVDAPATTLFRSELSKEAKALGLQRQAERAQQLKAQATIKKTSKKTSKKAGSKDDVPSGSGGQDEAGPSHGHRHSPGTHVVFMPGLTSTGAERRVEQVDSSSSEDNAPLRPAKKSKGRAKFWRQIFSKRD